MERSLQAIDPLFELIQSQLTVFQSDNEVFLVQINVMFQKTVEKNFSLIIIAFLLLDVLKTQRNFFDLEERWKSAYLKSPSCIAVLSFPIEASAFL